MMKQHAVSNMLKGDGVDARHQAAVQDLKNVWHGYSIEQLATKQERVQHIQKNVVWNENDSTVNVSIGI